MYSFLKIALSAGLILGISELAKRNVFLGALLASLPLVSLLSFCWIYYETRDPNRVAALSWEILWLVIPSLVLFAVVPLMIQHGRGFFVALTTGVAATAAAYAALITARRFF